MFNGFWSGLAGFLFVLCKGGGLYKGVMRVLQAVRAEAGLLVGVE